MASFHYIGKEELEGYPREIIRLDARAV